MNTYHFTFLLVLCLWTACTELLHAQATTDSIRMLILSAVDDTLKVRRLTELAKALTDGGKYDSALATAHWARLLSERLKDGKMQAEALRAIGWVYFVQSQYVPALSYSQQSLTLAEQTGYELGIANALNTIGNIYSNQSRYPQALEYFLKSLNIRKKLGDKCSIAESLNNIGFIYDHQSQYPQALEYFLKSLNIREEIGDRRGIAQSLNNIGFIYFSQSQYPQALEYFLKSLNIRETIGDKKGIAASLLFIGRLYYERNQYSQSLEYFLKSLNINEELGLKRFIAFAKVVVGNSFEGLGQLDSALLYHRQAYILASETSNQTAMASSLRGIASALTKQSKYTEALPKAQEALKLRMKSGERKEASETQALLATIYAALGNYKAAYAAQTQHHALKDSLFNADNAKHLTALQASYDAQKRASEEKLREAESRHKAELDSQEYERVTQFQYAAIAGVVLFVVALALAGRRLNTQQVWWLRFNSFVSFAAVVMLVEFALLFLDPWLDLMTDGTTLWRMAANVGIAAVIAPLQGLVEARLRHHHTNSIMP